MRILGQPERQISPSISRRLRRNEVEDRIYNLKDFDRTFVIDDRTKLVAKKIADREEAAAAHAVRHEIVRLPNSVFKPYASIGTNLLFFEKGEPTRELAWKLINGGVLPNGRVLFLTDRNSLKGQAYRAFAGFSKDDRVVIDSDTVKNGRYSEKLTFLRA